MIYVIDFQKMEKNYDDGYQNLPLSTFLFNR